MQNSVLWKKLYHNPSQYVKPREATVLSARMPREVTPEDYRLEKGAKTDRPPVATQFPSRYGYLPEINSPRPPDKSLVPVNGRKASPAGFNPNYDLDADERIRQLEVRLNVAEKSNRALLEEVLRLQGDVKTTNRRNEEVLREEKGSRHNLESAMKINNELITQLSARIKDAEEKLSEEKTALSSLVNHTKGVEQAVKSSQNELIAKKDVQSQKLIEMRAEIEELQGTKNQLERICFSMADDIRTLKMKMDQQSSELGTVSSELKNKSKKLEDDNRNQLEALRKTSNVQSQSDQQTTQLRGQVETRLSELRDVLVDVRAKQESEINERRTLEQQMSKKIYELQQSLSEANRRRDEGMHSMDILLREKDHASQADKLNLTSKVADTVEDVNKKLLSKEIKIREEMQERYLQLERLIHQEQQTRRESERAMREDTERKFLTLKHAIEELNLDVKEQFKNEKVKTKDTISKLDESISIVEKQSAENRKQFEKVMGAEISQRKMHEASTVEKLASVNEKLQIATSSLQQSIGGITQAMSSQNEKLKREVRGLVMEQKEASTRAMTDLDARMGYMKTRMNDFEEKLEARVATMIKKFENKEEKEQMEATAVLSQNLREKVDAISLWQDTTQQTIKQLSTSVTKLPEDLYALQEKQSLMKTDMDSRFNAESDARTKESEILKAEIQNLKQRHDPLPATKSDLDNIAAAASADPQVQGSVRKLADSIQTVKTVLGMKIQSEQKLRQEDVQKLQDEIAILRTALEPLVKKPLGKNFVKGRGNSEEVNKWNVANAYSRPIPNLDRGVTRDSGLEEDASEESENSEDSGRGIFSKLIKPTQKKNFDSSDSGEPVPKRQAPKKKRIKPTQKKNFDSSDSEPVSKKQAPKKKTKAKQKKKSETEESDDDEEDSTDESKRGHKSRSLSRRKRSRTRSKRRSKSRRRSSRRDRSRSYDRRYSRSPSRRRSRSRYRTPSRSRGRSRRRHKSRSRDRSRTRSRRRTPRRSYSRGRSRKPRRSRDRSRSHGRRRDRSRTPYSDRSRGRSRGRSRSRTPKRYRDKRTRRSRSRSPKRSRGRGRSRRRSLSESPRRRRSRKRSPSRKKTSRDEPKDRKKRKEGDPWKKDDYDKKQRKKRDEEKEKRMPTESEPDSEDDVERRKKARARRH